MDSWMKFLELVQHNPASASLLFLWAASAIAGRVIYNISIKPVLDDHRNMAGEMATLKTNLENKAKSIDEQAAKITALETAKVESEKVAADLDGRVKSVEVGQRKTITDVAVLEKAEQADETRMAGIEKNVESTKNQVNGLSEGFIAYMQRQVQAAAFGINLDGKPPAAMM